MAFKPNIDFSKLLETGRMTNDDLHAIFGTARITYVQRDYCRKLFRTKHPEKASLIRTGKATGLWLMTDSQSAGHHETGLKQACQSAMTRLNLHEAVPRNGLSSEEQKRLDRVQACARTSVLSLNQNIRRLSQGE